MKPEEPIIDLVDEKATRESFAQSIKPRRCEWMWDSAEDALHHVLNVTRIVAMAEWCSPASRAAKNAFFKGRAMLMVRRREINHCSLVLNESRLPKAANDKQKTPIRMLPTYIPREHIAEVSVVRKEGSRLLVGVRFGRAQIIHDRPFWFEASAETKRALILRHAERIKRLGLHPAWAVDEIIKMANAGDDKMRLAVMFRAVRRITINGCPFTVAILTIAPLGDAKAFVMGRVVYVVRCKAIPLPLTLPMFVRMNWSRPFSRRQLCILNIEHSCRVIAELSPDEKKRLAEMIAVTNDLDAITYRMLCALETMPALLDLVNKEIGPLWDGSNRHWALRYMEQANVTFGFGMALQFLQWARMLIASLGHGARLLEEIRAAKLAACSSAGWGLNCERTPRVVSLVAVEQMVKDAKSYNSAMKQLMVLRKALLQIVEDAEQTNANEGAITRMARKLLSGWVGR